MRGAEREERERVRGGAIQLREPEVRRQSGGDKRRMERITSARRALTAASEDNRVGPFLLEPVC